MALRLLTIQRRCQRNRLCSRSFSRAPLVGRFGLVFTNLHKRNGSNSNDKEDDKIWESIESYESKFSEYTPEGLDKFDGIYRPKSDTYEVPENVEDDESIVDIPSDAEWEESIYAENAYKETPDGSEADTDDMGFIKKHAGKIGVDVSHLEDLDSDGKPAESALSQYEEAYMKTIKHHPMGELPITEMIKFTNKLATVDENSAGGRRWPLRSIRGERLLSLVLDLQKTHRFLYFDATYLTQRHSHRVTLQINNTLLTAEIDPFPTFKSSNTTKATYQSKKRNYLRGRQNAFAAMIFNLFMGTKRAGYPIDDKIQIEAMSEQMLQNTIFPYTNYYRYKGIGKPPNKETIDETRLDHYCEKTDNYEAENFFNWIQNELKLGENTTKIRVVEFDLNDGGKVVSDHTALRHKHLEINSAAIDAENGRGDSTQVRLQSKKNRPKIQVERKQTSEELDFNYDSTRPPAPELVALYKSLRSQHSILCNLRPVYFKPVTLKELDTYGQRLEDYGQLMLQINNKRFIMTRKEDECTERRTALFTNYVCNHFLRRAIVRDGHGQLEGSSKGGHLRGRLRDQTHGHEIVDIIREYDTKCMLNDFVSFFNGTDCGGNDQLLEVSTDSEANNLIGRIYTEYFREPRKMVKLSRRFDMWYSLHRLLTCTDVIIDPDLATRPEALLDDNPAVANAEYRKMVVSVGSRSHGDYEQALAELLKQRKKYQDGNQWKKEMKPKLFETKRKKKWNPNFEKQRTRRANQSARRSPRSDSADEENESSPGKIYLVLDKA